VARSGEKPESPSQSGRIGFAAAELFIMAALLVICFGVVFLGIPWYVFGH
jgi:hypothetical protein